MNIRHAYVDTTLGEMLLVAHDEALVGAYFEGHTYPPAADAIGAVVEAESDHALLAQAATELRQYLAGERHDFTVPIHTSGDTFSEKVWQTLLQIPYGKTTTYGAIAAEFGSTGLAQRVGQAVGHNPICIIIPCHRVLGADGSLTGYAGGLERKRTLLSVEEPAAAEVGRLF